MSTRSLSLREAGQIADILRMAETNAKVARVPVLRDTDPIFGIARSIGDSEGNFARDDVDVRDCFLRVTSRSGFDYFWLVSSLMPLVDSHHFTAFDWS